MWSDEFNGDSLNCADWNVEIHEKGWVNNELQEYVDSAENIQVKDVKLIINPVKKVTDGDTGSTKEAASYTSGRVSTQNKQTFIYGRFECRAKVPKGQGYLPAFWLMANDENVYGQWPRCGEIDCMEVMGQETNKTYGTIHYGNPHSQSQGTYTITDGADFSDDFHIFTCDWEPGKITWYVDGVKYHEESDWHSTTVGQGTLSIANHEACNCSTGNFHICRFMEQLLHTGPDHPVKEQDDSTNFDCHTSRSGLYEFRYGKNLYDDNSSYCAYYCCISPLIKIYYCRCHTWRREGVNNLISFSIRADGLHICYVGHLFFSILKYEVQHIFYFGKHCGTYAVYQQMIVD